MQLHNKMFHLGLILLGLLTMVACNNMPTNDPDSTQSFNTTKQALTQEDDCFDDEYDGGTACAPTGVHTQHSSYACTVCHKRPGRVVFDSKSPAYRDGGHPRPTFNSSNKTCSNVGCHNSPSGNYTYYFQDGDGELIANTVTYGNDGGTTPPWNTTGSGTCNGCHSYPARLSNGSIAGWHSGSHGFTTMSNGNACQLCHPNVSGAYVYGGPPSYVGTSDGLVSSCQPATYCASQPVITNSSLHMNGTLDVTPTFSSVCLNCH